MSKEFSTGRPERQASRPASNPGPLAADRPGLLDRLIRAFVAALLWLRYRIVVKGLDRIAPADGRGILFLPNHPALIDPVIMLLVLTGRFRPRAVANRRQVDRPVVRFLARRVGVRTIGDVSVDGRAVSAQISSVLKASIAGLRRGEALLLYPAGRIYRQRLEDLGGNSAVELMLRSVPDVRVVLARTRGLWGSGFSFGRGTPPRVGQVLKRGLWGLLTSGLLFAPRRTITIEFTEPDDLPRTGDRNAVNRYLERHYNADAPFNAYVPYSIWERGGTRRVPEPASDQDGVRAASVPAATRELVLAHLREVTGRAVVRDEHRLAHDLGLDSLARAELVSWIEAEFGFAQSGPDALETVSDVLLAASGESVGSGTAELLAVNRAWWKVAATPGTRPTVPDGSTLTEVFLRAARRYPDQVIVADQISGAKTYRDLVTRLLVLKPILERLPGEYLGILLPASVAADVAYLGALFAGKTPVLLNWTTGPRNVVHALEHLGIQRVLSAGRLVARLKTEGFAEARGLFDRLLLLEDVGKQVSLGVKLGAAWHARTSWAELEHVASRSTAVVLFTSGSESQPKAVPLTHCNLLTNLRDVMSAIPLDISDSILAMLPPFHAFGLTTNVLLPLVTGIRAVYHTNPTEASTLASLIEAYELTAMVGTPTFLGGICRAARAGQLASLRILVTGAEKCPTRVYDALANRCPAAQVLEGYGITECSPVVSANRPGRARRETIGELLPSVEGKIVHPETGEPSPRGEAGMLLVRGPSVFPGYLKHDGASPFVEHDGKAWYRTGDLVKEDPTGGLTFVGRLGRFVKLGGEMISLPAIEAALEQVAVAADEAQGPAVAVEASPGEENVELVLFTTLELDRETANRAIRQAGLSPLHNIRRVVRVDALPLLGSGKIDYRSLKRRIAEG